MCRLFLILVAVALCAGPHLLLAQNDDDTDSSDSDLGAVVVSGDSDSAADSDGVPDSDGAADSEQTSDANVNNQNGPFGSNDSTDADPSAQNPFGFGGGGGGFGGGIGGQFDVSGMSNTGRYVQGNNVIVTWSEERDSVSGFSQEMGKWTRLTIERQDRVIPVVGGSVAAVQAGKICHAYSGKKGRWDTLELPEGYQAVPIVHEDMVMIRTKDHIYTFTASTGLWSSPSDPQYEQLAKEFKTQHVHGLYIMELLQKRLEDGHLSEFQAMGSNNRIEVRARRKDMDKIEELIRESDTQEVAQAGSSSRSGRRPSTSSQLSDPFGQGVAGPGPGTRISSLPPEAGNRISNSSIKARVREADERSLAIANQLRGSAEKSDSELKELREAVEAAFDTRLEIQLKEVQRMQQKVSELQAALSKRQQIRQQVIDRRVDELLNPDIDWSRQTVSQSTGQSQQRMPVYNQISGPSTPIGLPGPPHIPVGSPASSALRSQGVPRHGNPLASSVESQTNVGTVTDLTSPIQMTRELLNRRRFAESAVQELRQSLDYVTDAEQKLAESQKAGTSQNPPQATDSRKRYLDSVRRTAAGHQEDLIQAMVEWKAVWQAYESSAKTMRLDLDEAELELAGAMQKYEEKARANESSDNKIFTQSEIDEARREVELKKISMERTLTKLEAYQSAIESDSSVNPRDFEDKNSGLFDLPKADDPSGTDDSNDE